MDFPHAIRDILGLNTTTWLDQDEKEQHGVFNPDGNSVKEKYGASLAEMKGWPPRNYVSAHAAGDNVHLRDAGGTRFLGPEILGATPNADPREDELAASTVEGCAAALLKLGREKGIIPTPVIPPAVVVEPVAPKAASITAPWPDLTDLAKFLYGELVSIRMDLEAGVPKKGGGVPALKARAAMERLRAAGAAIKAEYPGVS